MNCTTEPDLTNSAPNFLVQLRKFYTDKSKKKQSVLGESNLAEMENREEQMRESQNVNNRD
jgi:hypothetical protein